MVEAKQDSAFSDVKILFDLENPTHQKMFEIWTAEKPLTAECPEVEEYVQNIEKDQSSDSPFVGNFAFVRLAEPDTHMVVIELRV
jgi:hypothetical protein